MENTVQAWVPKKIEQAVDYRSGQTPKSDELNSWFNLLISQGDWNADQIDVLTKFCDELEGEFSTLLDRVTALEQAGI